jgi:hypothetical protein
MATIRVNAELQSLFCFHGADEEASEPYLWVIMFTIDGGTVSQAGAQLSGSPAFFFSPGSHGNLGGGIHTGETRQIPPAVGSFRTTLQPIKISVGPRSVDVPGQLGMLAILLEENSTSDEGAEAAHRAINDLVRTELQEALDGINLVAIATEALPAINAGTDPVAAVLPIFKAKMKLVSDRIERFASSVAIAAIVQHMSGPGALIEGLDPDEFMGTAIHFFSQGEIDGTTNAERTDLLDRIFEPGPGGAPQPLEASRFVYNLHGEVWQPVEVSFTPITAQPPPGRSQVTGIGRDTAPTHRPFINHIGGVLADGSPWLLEKNTAIDLMAAGSHSFFVRGADGSEADLIVNNDNPQFPFLTTTADNNPANNLSRLPLCPLQIRHVVEVPS